MHVSFLRSKQPSWSMKEIYDRGKYLKQKNQITVSDVLVQWENELTQHVFGWRGIRRYVK